MFSGRKTTWSLTCRGFVSKKKTKQSQMFDREGKGKVLEHSVPKWDVWKFKRTLAKFCCFHTCAVGLVCHSCLTKCSCINWTSLTIFLSLFILISVRRTRDTRTVSDEVKSRQTTWKSNTIFLKRLRKSTKIPSSVKGFFKEGDRGTRKL